MATEYRAICSRMFMSSCRPIRVRARGSVEGRSDKGVRVRGSTNLICPPSLYPHLLKGNGVSLELLPRLVRQLCC